MADGGILAIGADLSRAVRDRPALVVGGGVAILIGAALLNRQTSSGETADQADPLADLFPGVTTGIPGSGSVPFPGYPVAGDGSSTTPPDLGGGGFPIPLPAWGLSCNGEPRPTIAGLPGTWACTEDGWTYVPPKALPPPPPTGTTPKPTPTPTPTPTSSTPAWAPAGLGPAPSNATGAIVVSGATYRWYSVSSGKIVSFKTVTVGAFRAYTDGYAQYPWPAQNSQRILVRIITGGHAGNYFSPAQAGVTYYPKR